MRVLVLNCGSSSMKYKLIDTATRKRVEEGEVERMAGDAGCADAVAGVLAELQDDNVEAVGHRVVHGGDRFHAPTLITPEVEAAIEACCPLAPSHNPRNLAAIRAAKADGITQVIVTHKPGILRFVDRIVVHTPRGSRLVHRPPRPSQCGAVIPRHGSRRAHRPLRDAPTPARGRRARGTCRSVADAEPRSPPGRHRSPTRPLRPHVPGRRVRRLPHP